MRAYVQTGYGKADVLQTAELPIPEPAADEVVVAVRAASVAAGDVYLMRGRPFVARFAVGFPSPRRDYVVGLDFAGVVEKVGSGVTDFSAGDEVHGECKGACAEFTRADAHKIARKPAGVSFEQAAAVPTSACTALQALRDQGHVRSGMRVLINGASGGVGTYAVQMAKALGAEVTGVCGTRNIELVRSLGADHVIDYTREDFTDGGPRYDVIIDNVASHSLHRARRALAPGGIHVPSSGAAGMWWIIKAALTAPFVASQGKPFLALAVTDDLEAIAVMIEAGTVAPVIDKAYSFAEVPAAFGYVDTGHANGKVVITVGPDGT